MENIPTMFSRTFARPGLDIISSLLVVGIGDSGTQSSFQFRPGFWLRKANQEQACLESGEEKPWNVLHARLCLKANHRSQI
jgi:hypothetical protein